MHDDGVVGHPRHPVAVEPVPPRVLALGREEGGVHPLSLHTQHHDRVGLRQHAVEVVRDLAGPGLDADGDQGGRGDQGDLGAEGVQQVDVGAGDPAVQDVADERDPLARQVLAEPGVPADEAAAHGEGVQEGLGGVLVGAVSCVDDGGVDPAGGGEAVRGAGGAVPDDDRVDAHGLQGLRGVLEGLALGDAGSLGREVDHVGGEALLGGLEGDPGPGGVLEEEVADGAAAQGRQLLDGPVGHPGHLLGGVEDQDGFVAGEVGGRDEVTHHRGVSPWWGGVRACGSAGVCPGPAGSRSGQEVGLAPSRTVSRPSSSASWTLTVSRNDVGRFLPT